MVTTMPAGENGAIALGEGTSGAMIRVIAPARTIRMRGGTKMAPNAGATMKHEPTRMKGHSSCASHASSCPVVSEIIVSFALPEKVICSGSIDQARDALEQLARVADQHLE